MRVLIVGAGPAGCYLAYLLRRQGLAADVRLVEQDATGSTFGFGVVFSDRALEFLREDDRETHDLIAPAMTRWTDLSIVLRGERMRIDGIGFAAIGRLTLLQALRRRLAAHGLAPEYGRTIASPVELRGYDLVVGADGAHSAVRRWHTKALGTTVRQLANRFAWYGTTRPFETLTQTFVETPAGPFTAHHYRYAADMSTFIVECDPATWARAGFAEMDEAEAARWCGRAFADTLEGHPLVSNRSIWRRFPVVANARWSAGNVVLVGDALHTAHFSIGSGTRLAMEDAIALARALDAHPADVPAALAAYEAARRPIVEALVAAATASAEWYESFPSRMDLPPREFAMSYIQRSGRVDRERLRALSPGFVRAYEASAPGAGGVDARDRPVL